MAEPSRHCKMGRKKQNLTLQKYSAALASKKLPSGIWTHFPNRRSPEERFYKFGSEPPIEPLYFGDLVGPFYIYLLWMGLALTAFVGESTIGCNFGATSARGRARAERREERKRKRKFTFKLRNTKDFDRGFFLEDKNWQ